MKVLYYSTCSCSQPHMGVLINSLLEDLKNGNDVYWLYCNKALSSCLMNSKGCGVYCSFCGYAYKQLFRDYGKNIQIIPLKPVHKKRKPFAYDNSADLKHISYKGVQVGYSILSFYISETRNMDFDVNDEKRNYIDYIAGEICDAIDALIPIVDIVKPEKMITYNGRYYENRFIYDIAKTNNINFNSLEVIGGRNEPYFSVHFPYDLPHSISQFTKLINKSWDESSLDENEKVEKASSFYDKRRNGIVAGDKVYISFQQKGVLPDSFDYSKHNIAIFNSSADEMAAVGGEWDESTVIFSTQYESIKHILNVAPPNYHFYLRIHPNLKDVKFNYHTDLYKLSNEYGNITIIEPKSTISSYSLMDACEKVIVFGSTMGVESCYWGKPVILIGTAFYAGMDVFYKVMNKSDILPLLEKKLEPKDRIGALKYAFFLMDREVRVDHYSNIDFNYENSVFVGQPIKVSKYLKLFGSSKLHAIVCKIFSGFICRVFRQKLIFPK